MFTGEVNLVSTHIGSEATSLMLTDNSEFEPSILFTSGIKAAFYLRVQVRIFIVCNFLITI